VPKDLAKKDTVDPLVPAKTPFGYNVGVNYESWEVGRTGYSITADLDQIYDNFHLIRTYHDAFGASPVIDGTQAQVIDWVVDHPGAELVMGTNNSALAQGGYGDPWSAGLMTSPTYTDAWVQMLIDAFGSVAKVKIGLKAILLGNEVDTAGPPPGSADFDSYVNTWIPDSFDNLKASLAAAGLGSIPISTTIANYGATNEVSVKIPAHIVANWASAWNNGEPFVLFNQYTPDNQQSTDFDAVETYFEAVAKALGTELEVFVGETGYSDDWGAANQATVLTELFGWLGGQKTASGGKTVPLFLFDAFDRPAYPVGEIGFGVYGENGQSQPTGIKTALAGVIPGWTDQSFTTPTKNSEALYGSKHTDTIKALAGDDIVLGLGQRDELFGQAGSDLLAGHAGRDVLRGGQGDDTLIGGRGHDVLVGCYGRDEFLGGRGKDLFVLTGLGTDTILDFEDGKDRFQLANDLRFGKLEFVEAGDDAEVRFNGEVVAIVESVDAGLLGRDDFLAL
jgi:Ca2+-binding RTX toxin-like protein